jgi:ribosomal protein S20
MKRKSLSNKKSNRSFKSGMKTSRKNLQAAPSRGGFRL